MEMKMKIICLFIIFTLLSSFSAFSQTNNFGKLFVNSLQAGNVDNRLRDIDKELLIENINKNITANLREQTNHTGKIDVGIVATQNISKIIHAIIETEKDIYKSEGNKYKYKINAVDNICFFAKRFSKLYPHETSVVLLDYLNDTNNWKVPTYLVLSYSLSGVDDNLSGEPQIISQYLAIFRLLSNTTQEGYFLNKFKSGEIPPVDKLNCSVRNCLQSFFAQTPLPEIEALLQHETNTAIIEILLFGVQMQPSDKAYEIYKKYYPKTAKYSTKSEISGMIKSFRQKCMQYENWNKRLKGAGYDKKKAEKQFKEEVAVVKTKLESFSYDNPKKLLELPELLQKAEDLTGEKPQSGMFPDRYLKPIKQKPAPECKEAYWQILQRNPDEDKYKIENNISATFGEAYGKVMTKEDVPKVIDYMNKQKSFKLIELMGNVLGKNPKIYKKNGTMGIVEGIRWPARKEIIQEFYKNKDKIKDKSMRKGFIEMAEKAGVAN